MNLQNTNNEVIPVPIMNTFDAIRERRSVKHYDSNHKLSDEEIEQLMSLALLSPTSFNIQNWRFVLVKKS